MQVPDLISGDFREEENGLKQGLTGATASVQRTNLPWAVPILTWIRRRCSSRADLVRPHVLSTVAANISQQPRKNVFETHFNNNSTLLNYQRQAAQPLLSVYKLRGESVDGTFSWVYSEM